jgi:hypothetical protein
MALVVCPSCLGRSAPPTQRPAELGQTPFPTARSQSGVSRRTVRVGRVVVGVWRTRQQGRGGDRWRALSHRDSPTAPHRNHHRHSTPQPPRHSLRACPCARPQCGGGRGSRSAGGWVRATAEQRATRRRTRWSSGPQSTNTAVEQCGDGVLVVGCSGASRAEVQQGSGAVGDWVGAVGQWVSWRHWGRSRSEAAMQWGEQGEWGSGTVGQRQHEAALPPTSTAGLLTLSLALMSAPASRSTRTTATCEL